MSTTTQSSSAAERPFSIRFAAALFAGSFALRLALVLLLKDPSVGPVGPGSNDDVEFNHLAASLANGDGFINDKGLQTSFRAPGFPIFLAGVYTLFGVNYPLVYVILCLLGAANSVLAYCLARELLKDGQARAVGILSCIYLGHLTISLSFISETLFVPLLTLGCWLFVRFLRFGSLWTLGAAGLVLGLATLTRPFSLLLLGLWGLILCWQFRRQPVRLITAGLVYAVPFLLPIIPWTVRNHQVHGHPVLMTTNGGSTFFGAANDTVYSNPRLWGYWVGTDTLPQRPLIDATPNEYEHDRMEWKLGKDWIRDNPDKAAFLIVMKGVSLWVRPPEFDLNGNPVYALRLLAYGPIFVLMFAGFLRCAFRRSFWRPTWMTLHLAILATVVTAMIFCGLARFRDANVSLMMIYVVLGWEGAWGMLRRPERNIV